MTERLRCRFGTREVPGLNPLIRTAYTCSHQPTQLSISGSVNEHPGYSFQNITLGPPSHRSTSAVKLPIYQPALTNKHCLLACCICKAEFPLTHFARCLQKFRVDKTYRERKFYSSKLYKHICNSSCTSRFPLFTSHSYCQERLLKNALQTGSKQKLNKC